MFRSYRIGSLLGFPIEVNLSFLFVLGLFTLWMGVVTGLVVALILFTSVLLHELGHALMARHLHVQIAGIELHFFGGAAKMTSQPRTANDEVAIAAAGPAVSFALGGLGFMVDALVGSVIFQGFGWINIILGSFNLIPALPMDGGRILRALLTRKMTFLRATEVSVTMTRGFALLLGVYGLVILHFFLPLLAALLWLMGSAELRMARMAADYFGYDHNGYRFHGVPGDLYGGPLDVAPPHDWPGAHVHRPGKVPFFSIHRPVRSSGFVIRRRNGRPYIEPIE
jgi:Zn-dependent protease